MSFDYNTDSDNGQYCVELFEIFSAIYVQVAPVTFVISRANLLALHARAQPSVFGHRRDPQPAGPGIRTATVT